MSTSNETVVLKLTNVNFRSIEYTGIGDFLVKKYSFRRLEEVNHEISEMREVAQIDRKKIILDEEKSAPIVIESVGKKTSSHNVLEGLYMDAKITVQVLGDIITTESLIEINGEEKYKTYNRSYQMIKLSSTSGYSLQQFLEKLEVDLGLSIDSKIWSFNRNPSA